RLQPDAVFQLLGGESLRPSADRVLLGVCAIRTLRPGCWRCVLRRGPGPRFPEPCDYDGLETRRRISSESRQAVCSARYVITTFLRPNRYSNNGLVAQGVAVPCESLLPTLAG